MHVCVSACVCIVPHACVGACVCSYSCTIDVCGRQRGVMYYVCGFTAPQVKDLRAPTNVKAPAVVTSPRRSVTSPRKAAASPRRSVTSPRRASTAKGGGPLLSPRSAAMLVGDGGAQNSLSMQPQQQHALSSYSAPQRAPLINGLSIAHLPLRVVELHRIESKRVRRNMTF
jgi:hypothetical protein